MAKYKEPRRGESTARRAKKSWVKGERHGVNDDEAVPRHAVSMKPRVREIVRHNELSVDQGRRGRVVTTFGRNWVVELLGNTDADIADAVLFYECVPSRSIVSHNPGASLLAVGDVVVFYPTDEGDAEAGRYRQGVILAVEERKTKLAREAAGRVGSEQVIVSNIEQVVVVMAAADPFYNRRLLDRYLIEAELGGLAAVVCINKIELMDPEFVAGDLAMYTEELGIPVLLVSAQQHAGIEELKDVLSGKTSVFSGPSGVGKSTLLNLLIGDVVQATGAFSKKYQTGVHTTSFTKLFRLPNGGYVADTPGIREFGIWNVDRENLSFYFHDFDDFRYDCRFPMCTHTHEPECAVKSAVEDGMVDPQRYESYCNIFESMEG